MKNVDRVIGGYGAILSRTRSRRAFTLIETVAVLVILGMIAGLAVVSLQGHVKKARFQQALEQLDQADRFARSLARKESLPHELTFDFAKNHISLGWLPVGSTFIKPIRTWRLPTGVKLAELKAHAGSQTRSKGKINIASNGTTPMYAVKLRQGTQLSKWWVCLGFSGQTIRIDKDNETFAMFKN
jgi:prepilin-type N-terminal cleavage/methylation domain-containing protein